MNKIIEKFSAVFADEKFLLFSFLTTMALYTVNVISKLFCELYSLFIIDLVFVLCIAFLYVAYRKHNKNVQKGLLGATIMWYLYDEVNYVVENIILDKEAFARYDNFAGRAYIYVSIITMLLYVGLFINHFIINGDHHSRSGNVFLNQLLVLSTVVISIVAMIFQALVFTGDVAGIIEVVSWHLGLSAFVLMIAAYESRFNAYKIKREAADE